MDAFQSRFASTLRSNIEAKVIDESGRLVGAMASDYPSYTERCGFIRGLKFALQEAADLETAMSRSDAKPIAVVTTNRRGYES